MKVVRSDRVAFRAFADGAGGVILNLENSLYFSVNSIGAAIWDLIGEGGKIEDIIEQLRTRVDDPPLDLENDVRIFLNELAARNLVTLSQP